MEPIATLVIGLVAVAATVALASRSGRGIARRRSTRETGGPGGTVQAAAPPSTAVPDGPPHLRPARIVVVGDPRHRLPGQDIAPAETPAVDPRPQLLRDTSAVLVALGGVVIVAAIAFSNGAPNGAVLSATSAPASAAVTAPASTAPALTVPASSATTGAGPDSSLANASPTAVIASGPGSTAVGPTPTSTPVSGAIPTPRPALASAPPPAAGRPSASRLALLTPCAGRSGCYLYVVRTGDTLFRIASFFGVAGDAILRLNPQITDPSVVVRGSTIVLPAPTR